MSDEVRANNGAIEIKIDATDGVNWFFMPRMVVSFAAKQAKSSNARYFASAASASLRQRMTSE